MASRLPPYTRLTRDAGGVGTYTGLWLSAEHLIIVRSTGYSENYVRLQLADIQGIFLTRTVRRLGWAIFWGIVAGGSAGVVIYSLVRGVTPVASVILLVVGTMAFLWNHLLGPGCRAFVVTGVQTAELPALVRAKKARGVVARLQSIVGQVQPVPVTPPATPSEPAPPALG